MAHAPRSAVFSMRLPHHVKAQVAALAAQHQLSESGLLCKLLDEVLRSNTQRAPVSEPAAQVAEGEDDVVSEGRITLRLRRGDRARASAHACARGMKTGTYLTLLIHNHVRAADVLPPQELDLLKSVGAQLAAVGRQLRMFDLPNTLADPQASALRDLLGHVRHEVALACEASAAVVRRNLRSWEGGHD